MLRDVGRLEPRGDAFALLDLVPGAEAPVRRHGAPLVGRRREAALVRHAVERAADERRAHLLTVLGAPGVGKSRLAAEAIAELPAGWRVARGRCAAYGEAAGLRPLADVAAEAAGAAASDPPAEAFARIEQALAAERRSEALAARLAGLLGLREPGPPEETAWALRRLLEAVASRAPLLVVLDDLHWAEPGVLDAIGHVAEHAARPLVLLCLARPELLDLRPGFGGGLPNASSVRLEPLPPPEAARLARELLGGDVDPRVEAGLLEAAGGNPLFTEELVAMLRDDGRLARAGRALGAGRHGHRAERAADDPGAARGPPRRARRRRAARPAASRGGRRDVLPGHPRGAERRRHPRRGRAGALAAPPARPGASVGRRRVVRLPPRPDPGRGLRGAAAGTPCGAARAARALARRERRRGRA